MKVKMRDEDRQAVDVLMDRAASAAARPKGVAFAPPDSRLGQCVAKVERVLALLDELPASEPSRGLISRTLRMVQEASGRDVVSAAVAERHLVSGNQPVA